MERESMKPMPSEQDVRDLYLRNAPSVEGGETWEAIRDRLTARKAPAGPRRGRVRRGRLRVAAVALGAVVIIGAASAGIYEAVTHWGGSGQVLVIGDGETTFLATGETITVTSPAGETVVLTGTQADLYREVYWMREGLESGSIVLDPEAFYDTVPAGLADDAASDVDLPSFVEMVASNPYSVLDVVEASLFGTPLPVTIYLKASATVEEVSALQTQVESWPEVESLTFISKEDALERIKQLFADKPEIWENLTSNPLPDSFEVRLLSGSDVDSFIQRCLALPEVDEALRSQTDVGPKFAMLRALVYRTGYAGWVSETSGMPSTASTAPASAETSTTTAIAVDPASFRTVLHPYHNSYFDYLGAYANGLPTDVDPAVETAAFPSVLPAYRAEVRPLPETDLEFETVVRGDSEVVSQYLWEDPETESYVTNVTGPTPTAYVPREPLFDANATQATAEAFLKEHGLWQPDLVVGEVRWEPYEDTGPSEIHEGWFDFWAVRFDQNPPSELAADAGGFPGAVEVLVSSSGQAFRVSWSLLDLTRDGNLRLRPVQEVLTDLDAWTSGAISDEVNEWGGSPSQMIVTGVDIGLVRNDYARADDTAARYLVPVYEFAVNPVEAGGQPGIWYVVAAEDTTP
jgi:hypothetical protein